MIRTAVIGIGGRMGSGVARSITYTNDIKLIAGIEHPHHSMCNKVITLGGRDEATVRVVSDLEDIIDQIDVVVDFSNPKVTIENVKIAGSAGVPFISGTTNLAEEQHSILEEVSRTSAVLWSSNMSIGINIMLKLVDYCSKQLGESFDIGILDIHHNKKKDAPSGTAKTLLEYAHLPDAKHEVASLRLGNVVGDHTVYFCGLHERLEIIHRGQSREAFAQGTVKAIRFMAKKKLGLFSMQDVFGKIEDQ